MKARCRPSRRWRSRIVRGLAYGLLLGLLAIVVLQVLLATPWVKNRVAAKLSTRIGGLPVKLQSLGWTPWSGATIRGLSVAQPPPLDELLEKPLLYVESIRVWPDYRAAIKGEWVLDGMEIEEPSLYLSMEMLATILAAAAPAEAPVVTLATADPAPIEAPPLVALPDALTREAQSSEDPPAKPETVAKTVIQASDFREPMWLRVTGGSLSLVSVSVPVELAGFDGLSFDLPLFGRKSHGDLAFGEMRVAGRSIETDVVGVTGGEDRVVTFSIPGTPEAKDGVALSLALKLVNGLPFEGGLKLRVEELERVVVRDDLKLGVGWMEMGMKGQGWLQAPASWSGMAQLSGQSLEVELGGMPLTFDRLGGGLLLQQGLLRCPDMRLIGDQLALLGNGWVSVQDGSGVLRVVVPEGGVKLVNQKLIATDSSSHVDWQLLEPGNRSFMDLSIWRDPQGWMLGLGQEGSVLPLSELLEKSGSAGVR